MEIVGNDLLTYVVKICVYTLLHMVYYITLINRKDLFTNRLFINVLKILIVWLLNIFFVLLLSGIYSIEIWVWTNLSYYKLIKTKTDIHDPIMYFTVT